MCSKQENTETTSQIPSKIVPKTTPETVEEVLQEVVEEPDTENEESHDDVFVKDTCLNCGTRLTGKYCHNCGQHVTDRTMTVKIFLMDYFENAFLWDSRIGSTLKTLITRPGVLTRDYLAGKFVSQVQPIKLNMFLLLVFVTLFVFFGSDRKMTSVVQRFTSNESVYPEIQMGMISGDVVLMERINASPRDTLTIQAPLSIVEEYPTIVELHKVIRKAEGGGLDEFVAVLPRVFIDEKIILSCENDVYYFNPDFNVVSQAVPIFVEIWEQLSQLVVQYFPMIILLTAPFVALSLRLVQHRKKRSFYDHFVFSMHYIAFLELIIILIYVIHLVLKIPVEGLNFIFALSSVVYLALSFREVYETAWLRSVTKAIFSSLIYYAICFAIFLILVIIAIFMVAGRYV